MACGPRSHPHDVGSWPREAPPGLVAIETRPQHAGCTGAIFHNARGVAYVLTAAHCVTPPATSGRLEDMAVIRPEGGERGPFWRRYTVARVWKSSAIDITVAENDEVRWIADWAVLEIPTSTRLPIMPLLESGRAPSLKEGELVSLESFFDVNFESLRPHTHEFEWGRFSRELVQSGHSGAPVLWNGKLVAVFSGATFRRALLFGAPKPDKLTLSDAETIRREAASSGLVFDPEPDD
jgi:hypothetical protein